MTTPNLRRFGAIAASVALAAGAVFGTTSAATAITVSPTIIDVTGNDFEYSVASAGGDFVALSGYSSGTVTIIDTATNTPTDVSYGDFTPFDSPGGVAFSPDGSTLYMVDYGTDSYVIHVATATVTSSIRDASFNGIWTLAVTADGATAIIGNYSNDTAIFVDLETESFTTSDFSFVNSVYSEYISPDGTLVYFVDYSGSVDIFNVASGALVGGWDNAAEINGGYYSSCLSPDALTLFLPDNNGAHIAAVSMVDGSVIAINDTDVSSGSYSCVASPDGQSVYLTNYNVADPGQFDEFSAADLSFIASHDIAGLNYSQTIAFAECRAYVNGYDGGVAVIEGFAECGTTDDEETQPELAETGFTGGALTGLALASLITAAGVFALKRRTA